MRLHIHATEGWVKVPLLDGSVALESARLNGRPASIVLEDGAYTLVTDKRGDFDIELTFAASVESSLGSFSFTVPLLPSGATEVEIAVPTDEDLGFTIANARRISSRRDGSNQVVVATLPPAGNLSVSWQRKVPSAEEKRVDSARVYSEVTTLVGVGDGLVRAQATVQNTILFAGVNRFDLRIPDGVTLLDVQGAGLRDWTLSDDNTLTVQLNFAAEYSYTLQLDMERVVGEGRISVDAPVVVPLGVERSRGFVGVEAVGNLEVKPAEVTGATAVDVRTLPATILGRTSQPVLLGYKYLSSEAQIPLVITQHDEIPVLVTLADQAEATTMFTADGRRLTSVRYEVRNNRRQFLRLALPENAELWSASVAGRSVQPASSGGELLVPLIRSATSGRGLASFAVEVVYVESGPSPDRGRTRFESSLPTIDVPTTYVSWVVYAPSDSKVSARGMKGSVRPVKVLSRPLGAVEVLELASDKPSQQRASEIQADGGSLGDGAAPVRVRLPLEGTPYAFEKLIALDEKLWVAFDVRGLPR